MKYSLWSLIGLVVFLGVVVFSVTAQAAGVCPPDYNDNLNTGVCLPNQAAVGLSESSVMFLLSTFLKWLLGITSVLGVLAFVISGIQYLTAAGDEDQAKTAKRNMQYTVIGVVVALSGLIIITAIDQIFKGFANF